MYPYYLAMRKVFSLFYSFIVKMKYWLKSLPRTIIEVVSALNLKKLLLAASPFVIYLLIFSFNRQLSHAIGLERYAKPHYRILSQIELKLFFCNPHHFLAQFPNPIFDALAAVPYLVHFPLPVLFILYLIINPKRREAVYPYIWCQGVVNLIAVCFQMIFPTAPPWYTDTAVFDSHRQLIYDSPNEAGFSRLDRLFHISLFHALYGASPLKFGAFPSLHVSWPTVILVNHPWGGWKLGILHVIWISLSAMYITHHYFIDCLGGIALVFLVRLAILKVWSPFPELPQHVDNYISNKEHLPRSYNIPNIV